MAASKRVVLITTGGTISTFASKDGTLSKLGGRALLARLGASRTAIPLRVIEFAKIPSCEMTPERMADLASLVRRELGRGDVAGAVVTHGTDTIEESAFLCHLTVPGPKPVVFTGSMRMGSDLSWDGPRNLLDAISIAQSRAARGVGAMLTMNEEIHSARFVTKTNGQAVSTFHSPACGPLGRIYNGEPWIMLTPTFKRVVLAPRLDTSVAMVTALAGEIDALREALERPNLRGLVVAGFGGGRVPHQWIEHLKQALARGIAVVLASRTGAGAIDDGYGLGGAHYLRSVGLIAAHEVPAHKARLKLMLALGNGRRGAALKRYMEAG
ncbi:MAG: asparaginase [Candidatus Binataceae bacterium]